MDFIQFLLNEFDFSSKKNIPEILIEQSIEKYIEINPNIYKRDLTRLFKKKHGSIITIIKKI